MSNAIRIWGVDGDALTEIPRQGVDFERRLEDWMDSDVSVLSDDLLVIGRQLDTDGGGILDLLCLDRNGDVVIVELKRGKTPRDVVAQTLDYAAWAAGLSFDDVKEIGDRSFPEGLDAAFRDRFDADLPDVLNAEHRMLVVASEVDPRSERIIRYLSEAHGVSINAVTFNYFRTADGAELLARTHLVEPEVAEQQSARRSGSKRGRRVAFDDHRAAAERVGVGGLFDQLTQGLNRWLFERVNKSSITYYIEAEHKAAFNVVMSESDAATGLRYNAYTNRLARVFDLDPNAVVALLPSGADPWVYSTDASSPGSEWEGHTGVFRSTAEVDRLLAGLAAAPAQPG